jgi:hypothetical protein
LHCPDDVSLKTRLERAFLMTDIHARQAGVIHSGATVACCLVEVRDAVVKERPKDVELCSILIDDIYASQTCFFFPSITLLERLGSP